MRMIKWLLEIIALENLSHACDDETCVVNPTNRALRTCRVCGTKQMLVTHPQPTLHQPYCEWKDI